MFRQGTLNQLGSFTIQKCYCFTSDIVTEAVKPSVEISGRVYVSGGNIVDMNVGDNLTAIVTTPVNINCSARGIPKPSMRWHMNGQQLGKGGNYKTDNNGALVIRGIQNPGEFKCIAENFLGQAGASSFISLLGLCILRKTCPSAFRIHERQTDVMKTVCTKISLEFERSPRKNTHFSLQENKHEPRGLSS